MRLATYQSQQVTQKPKHGPLMCQKCHLKYFCCRVMVLDAGQIKEFDSPSNLLKNNKTIFYGMAKDAGVI